MIKNWITNLQNSALNSSAGEDESQNVDYERIAAHMLIEVARADFEIDDDELATIRKAISQSSSLTTEELDGIVAAAGDEADRALSYHEPVKAINDHFDQDQKRMLVQQMWRVAYADQQLDRYEEAFIRKFCDLIYLSHKDFIQAKLHVTGEL